MLQKLTSEIKASMSIFECDADDNYGILAEFKDPGALYHAAHDVHHEGYRKFDTYSPFPIHGMDKAMGLGNSKVGFITLGGGLTGLALGTWPPRRPAPAPHPLQGLGAGFVPEILDTEILDDIIQISRDEAFEFTRRAAKEEGLLVGVSSGAALAAIAKKASELPEGSRVLTFCYDTGERYLSVEGLFPTGVGA